MTTVIFFREGLSGHYLKSIIDDSQNTIGFRVDPWYPTDANFRKKLKFESCTCLHKHLVDWEKISRQFNLTLTIQVQSKIYHAIYNNFHKKYLVENPNLLRSFKTWKDNYLFWYDLIYYNIKEYYELFRKDLAENQLVNIIEFDNLLELDYVEQIMKLYYNKSLTDNMVRIVKEYSQTQLQYNLTSDKISMEEITSTIPDFEFDKSPWFAAYCIFAYETNNNLKESQRNWCIDSINNIDKKMLIDLSKKYDL